MVAASEIISKPKSRRRFLRSGLRGFRAEITDQRSRITVHYENAEVGSEKLEASGVAAIPCSSNSYLLTSNSSLLYDYKRLLCETDTVGGAISQTYASDTTEEFGDLIGEDGQYIHQYDAQANTNALLDETGTVQAQYKYFAFGQVSAVSIDGGAWTAEDWQSLPLGFTSNMLAGGKKQYYLDQEIALYLLGSGNNGRYYDATTGRFLSEDPTGEAGGDENLFRYTGNDPVNNLDPSGHKDKKDPPGPVYHPPQNQPAQNPNANAHATAPAQGQSHQPPSDSQLSSAEHGILNQASSQSAVPDWAVPKAGEPLAGPASSQDSRNRDHQGIPDADFGRAAHDMQKMNQQEGQWLAAHHLSGTGNNTGFTVPQGARPIPYPGELSPAALQYRSPGDTNPPSYVQAIGGHLWYFPLNDKGTHTPALPPGAPPFAPPSYNGPLPPLHLPPGVNLIPGVKSFVQAKQDFNWQRYNQANQKFQWGLAAVGVTLIGAMARDLDVTPGLLRGFGKGNNFSLPLAPESRGAYRLMPKFENVPPTMWNKFPAGVPRPTGAIKLLEGNAYATARQAADQVNRQLSKGLGTGHAGYDIHEIIPVKFGGSPTSLANKVGLPRPIHSTATAWFRQLQRLVQGSD